RNGSDRNPDNAEPEHQLEPAVMGVWGLKAERGPEDLSIGAVGPPKPAIAVTEPGPALDILDRELPDTGAVGEGRVASDRHQPILPADGQQGRAGKAEDKQDIRDDEPGAAALAQRQHQTRGV